MADKARDKQVDDDARRRIAGGWRTEQELLADPACWDSPIRIFGLDTPIERSNLDMSVPGYAGRGVRPGVSKAVERMPLITRTATGRA